MLTNETLLSNVTYVSIIIYIILLNLVNILFKQQILDWIIE